MNDVKAKLLDPCDMTMVERKRFLVFGNPSDGLRAIFDGFNADYGNPFGGFSRF